MTNLFIKMVNMSISAGWIVLAVLILRLFLKKAPQWVKPLLWAIVGLRLVMPFTMPSIVSLLPSAETISPQIMYETNPKIDTGITILDNAVNPIISQSFAPNPGDSANPLQIWIPIFAIIWLIGIAVMLGYMAVSYIILRKSMKTAVLYAGDGAAGIYLSDKISFPFVLGFFRPVIYLPFSIKEHDIKYVLSHERAHIARKDHFFKPFSFLLLSVYWFHPLLWLAYLLLGKDMEFACDEQVIGRLPREELADYSQALLSCSIGQRKMSVCPLTFGEVSVKDRVKNVLNYKKPAFWLIVAAGVLVGVLGACFLTDPVDFFQSDEKETDAEVSSQSSWFTVSSEVLGSANAAVKMADWARQAGKEPILADNAEVIAVTIDNTEELDTFWETMKKELTFKKLLTQPGFYGYVKKMMSEEDREGLPVIIFYIPSGNLINEYSIDTVQKYDEELMVLIERTDRKNKDVSFDGYLIALWVGAEYIDEVSGFDILVEPETKVDGTTNDSEVLASYVCKDSKGAMAPSVTLYEDGEFTFFFSAYSSYIGYGTYQMDGDTLTLRTDDGRFLYTFEIVEDTLVFDEENSSEALWYSNITDGSVFYSSLGKD